VFVVDPPNFARIVYQYHIAIAGLTVAFDGNNHKVIREPAMTLGFLTLVVSLDLFRDKAHYQRLQGWGHLASQLQKRPQRDTDGGADVI